VGELEVIQRLPQTLRTVVAALAIEQEPRAQHWEHQEREHPWVHQNPWEAAAAAGWRRL